MPMIYYTGPTHDWDPDISAPTVIVGTDLADNVLVSIKSTERVVGAIATTDPYSAEFFWTFPAFNQFGAPITATVGPFAQPPCDWLPECCVVRSDGWIFAPTTLLFPRRSAGDDVLVDFIRVFRRNGDRVSFPQLHGARIMAMAFDADNNIIVGGDEYSNTTYCLRKYSADGETLIWSATHSSLAGVWLPFREDLGCKIRIEKILVDTDGSIYVQGRRWMHDLSVSPRINDGFVAKYTANGIEVWSTIQEDPPGTSTTYGSGWPPSIVINGDHLFSGLYTSSSAGVATDLARLDKDDGSILDYRPANNYNPDTLWTMVLAFNAAGTEINGINYNVGGFSPPAPQTRTWLRTWDVDDLQQYASYENLTYDLYIPAYENFIILPDDTIRTSYRQNDGGYAAEMQHPVRVQFVEETEIPPIPIALNLAPFDWQGDRYTLAPPLPLRMGVGIPALQREYSGALTLPEIYRATLSGSPDLTLALSSFSVRRDVSGVSLSVVSPITDSAQVDDILARVSGTLTLWRGVRFLDGTEQLEPMLSVPLAGGIRYDLGAKAASATLSGETVEPIAPTVQTRTLRGISYRSESSGARRVRCAVDTFIRPGDTADLGGGETMTAADLVYNVSAFAASMEVAE
jgi:hypothetical protein